MNLACANMELNKYILEALVIFPVTARHSLEIDPPPVLSVSTPHGISAGSERGSQTDPRPHHQDSTGRFFCSLFITSDDCHDADEETSTRQNNQCIYRS